MWWFTGGVSRRAQSGGWCRRCGWAVAGQGVMNRNDTRGGAGLLGGRGWWFLGLPAGKGKRFCRGGRYRAGRLGRVRWGVLPRCCRNWSAVNTTPLPQSVPWEGGLFSAHRTR